MAIGPKEDPNTQSFSLSDVGIDSASEWVDERLSALGCERMNCLRVRLLLEEVLLNASSHYNDEQMFTVSIETWLRRQRVRIKLHGEAYNPLGVVDSELGDWSSSLRTAIGLNPRYSYSFGVNCLYIPVPYHKMNPVLKIVLAILIGTVAGIIGRVGLSPELLGTVSHSVLSPLYDIWTRILNAVSGPIIFFTIITTMLNTKHITDRGGNSLRIIARYFIISFIVVAVALLFAIPVFPLTPETYLDTNATLNLLRSILYAIPENLIDPFAQANTVQLLIIAFVIGYALLYIGSQVDTLKHIIQQVNMVGLLVARWVSMVVPYLTGVFLCLKIWAGQTMVAAGLWAPILVALATSLIALAGSVLLTSASTKTSPALLAKKISQPFLIALRTGSLDEACGEAERSCTSQLGINRDFTKVSLPQGLVLYMPVSAIGTCVFTMFAAQAYGITPDVSWYAVVVVLAVVIFVATPPVPGANLLAYVVFFATLGIPAGALLDAMVFDIIFGVFAAAANQAMLQVEMVLQAKYIGLLDVDKLHDRSCA